MADSAGGSSQPLQVRAGQIDLAVTQAGQGTPLVLVHGFPLDHTMWQPQITEFSEHFRVIAPDLRGFGASAWPVRPAAEAARHEVSMELMADDVAHVLDALGVHEPVVLCGLSMGGYVAFQFLRKYGSQVRALVLCDTRSVADTATVAAARLETAKHVLAAGTESLAESMLPKLFAAASFGAYPAMIEATRQMIYRASRQGVAAALGGLASRPDASGMLGEIRVPTLVMVGRHDAISSPEEMQIMAASIPGAQFVVLPEAGHMSPLESPAAFNQSLAEFLAHTMGH
jgi:pimeloyl-ACP methyl ester carboxylesterase